MYALSEHTILDTLEGYRSSGIHKERSKVFFYFFFVFVLKEDFPTAGIYFFILLYTIFSLFVGGGQGHSCAAATCLRMDGSGDSDQAGVGTEDQGHGFGLWLYREYDTGF